MSFKKIIRREIEVAFSKNAQPLWVRILKYIALAGIIYFFWNRGFLWLILVSLFGVALIVHFWVRYKTKGWTISYGAWDYEKNKPKYEGELKNEKIKE